MRDDGAGGPPDPERPNPARPSARLPDPGRPDPGRPDPGRHRHGRPGTTPPTPAMGWPAVPPRGGGSRHSRVAAPGHGRPSERQASESRSGPPAAPGSPLPSPVRDGAFGPTAGTPHPAGSLVTTAGPSHAADPTDVAPRAQPIGPPSSVDAWPSTAARVEEPAAAVVPDPTAGHGHAHAHQPARPAGRRVRVLIAALLVPCGIAALIGLVLLWPGNNRHGAPVGTETPVHAAVIATSVADCSPGSGDGRCMAVGVRSTDGPLPGGEVSLIVPVEPSTPRFAVGDQVVLAWSGADPNDPGSYRIADFQRGTPLIWLAALFAAAVLVLGRWRGLAALVALALSFAVLLLFVLPAILAGSNPLAVAVVGACLIMFAVLYLTHGFSARTSTAVLGTLASLALIGVLGTAFSAATRLTGIDDTVGNLIAALGGGIDARGLLLAGIVIGALGVLDDVTVTQTSAVWELRRANPDMGARALFTSAMRIGRDHVSSAVNTLVLAYAGASLPLMLIFSLSGRGLSDVVTTQEVATEIVRTLVGSIGLVASVPITTALAAVVASRETPESLRV
ncbi:YibE/F family protein [Pseudonocardia sp. GCM10023141]|uniref:YibE/F family protein n=1 Tax=Pseudonocardia sp. GCM10023141 TaxID=3252653 RepID=UPI003615C0DA